MVKEDSINIESVGQQEKILEEALQAVRNEAFQMKRHLDKDKLMDALKSCSQMLSQLQTGELTPKYYYRLYIDVTNELQHLDAYLMDEFAKGNRLSDLYELVQYAGNIIPRLYLMVTVGVVYIKTNEASRKDIMKDLVEMIRGVQHPLRGLFLRSYLLQSTRSLLPDQLTEKTDSKDGVVKDAVEFILLNFCEMNKLWVRMQYQGTSKDKDKREKERHELRILVGTNLVRLSQLENLDVDTYIKVVLPAILEQVVSCKDHIAQEYLMECVIQVFPDEFHFSTLNTFLKACAELHQSVNVKNLLTTLIDRLATFVSENPDQAATLKTDHRDDNDTNENGISPSLQKSENGNSNATEAESAAAAISLFDVFARRIGEVVESLRTRRVISPLEDAVAMHGALLSLAHRCYPTRVQYVDATLGSVADIIANLGVSDINSISPVGKELTALLKTPVLFYNDVSSILSLANYSRVLQSLDYAGQCRISSSILSNMLDNYTGSPTDGNTVSTAEQCDKLLNLLQVLVKSRFDKSKVMEKVDEDDERDTLTYEAADRALEDFHEEQTLMARLICVMSNNANPDQYYVILNSARKHFGQGGRHRFKYTLPPLVFGAYKVLTLYKTITDQDDKWDKKVQKVLQFAHQTISALVKEAECAELALRLFLQGAQSIDRMPKFSNQETTAYEFFSQALSLYEDEIGDSKSQLWAITLIVGTLQKLTCFSVESAEPLRSQCVLAASKLFKKPDQCRGVAMCAHLFWPSVFTDEQKDIDAKKAADCIKKALKICSQCMDPTVQAQLYIELLNANVYLSEKQCPGITMETIEQLEEQIEGLIRGLEDNSGGLNTDEIGQIKKHFTNTKKHMEQSELAAKSKAMSLNGSSS